jgi:diguanylate cyclase (GGDEF)-like protein/putative nucleotidyltransferase with HDIG domain
MKTLNLSSYNLQTKFFWAGIILLAGIFICFSIFESFSFTLKDWMTFGVAATICIILSQYRIKLPRSRGYVLVREPAIFFGIIWLGIGGGVLVALAGAIGNFRRGVKSKVRWFVDMSVITLTTFVSAGLFYLLLNYGFGVEKYPIYDSPVAAFQLMAGLVSVGFTHYFLYSLIYSVFLKLHGSPGVSNIWKDNFILVASISAFCIGTVFVIHLLTRQFGLLFGLVVLPIIVFGHIAFRFHRKTLAQKTKEITEASRIHLATVEALATAIDARDQIGRGHISRTQIYALGVGKILNLPVGDLEALKTGALLHDIGKLAVPDHILNKPGRLTPAEMEKAKIHPVVGASILEKVNFPYPVIPTVKYHHEMWDGTGYPKGLAKEEIPLTARILSVADAYDTLRGSRPYRPAVSREDARKFLVNGAGGQFDPKIVDIFLRNLRVFEEEIETQGLSYSTDDEGENGRFIDSEATVEDGYIEQIKRANREVFTLYELARVFSSSLNLEETYSLFVKKIAELVSVDTCAIYILDSAGTVATAQYVEGANKESIIGRKIKPGEGATGYTLKKRQSVYNINPALDFSFYRMDFIQDYSAMASLPLLAGENLIGAVSLYSCELENYEDDHMRLLETVSRIASDAIAQSLQHAETESKALTDPMTGLPNARSLEIHFDKEIARARRNGTSLQVLMLDLDGFKAINDTHGHKAGDKLLKEISGVMREQLRDYDFLARYAGDEFVAIIPETDRQAVMELCQRMDKSVREYRLDVGQGGFAGVGVSLGAAAFPNNGDSLDEILAAADKAMYLVKERRKAATRRKKQQEVKARRELEEMIREKPAMAEEVKIENVEVEEVKIENVEVEEVKIENIEVEKTASAPDKTQKPEDDQSLIVELDESHIINSKTVN